MKHRVLVADDDARGIHFLRGLLTSEGYELACASDGPEALALARECAPDVVLLDVMMPGMDGFEVCAKLRQDPKLSQVPILLLTALDDRESKLQGLEAGADDFISKPFDATELLVRLRTITRLSRFRHLAEQRTRFEQIVTQAPDAIVITNRKGCIHMVNAEFLRMASLGEQESAVGQNLLDWLVGPSREQLGSLMEACGEHGRFQARDMLLSGSPDQESLSVEISAIAIPWDGKGAIQLQIRDVSERKRLEAQVLRYQRIELLGELAGSIVHDINNVLSALSGNLSLLEMVNTLDAESVKRVAGMQKTILRGSDILKQLLSFTRGSDGSLVPLDPKELVREVAELLHPVMKYNYEVLQELEESTPGIEADPSQIHQVVMNLCMNARDAMPEGGKLVLRADRREIREDECKYLGLEAKPGTYACLSVRDTGTGMPEHVRTRIFEPFFTTKEAGKGTGLGLATVLRIVRRHHGFVTVQSAPGEGTSFHCHFPALPEEGSTALRGSHLPEA